MANSRRSTDPMFGFIWADLRRHWAGVLAVVLLIALASALGTCVTLGERPSGSERARRLGLRSGDRRAGQRNAARAVLGLSPARAPPPSARSHAGSLRADPRVAYAAPVGFGDFVGDDPVVGTTGDVVGGLGGLAEGGLSRNCRTPWWAPPSRAPSARASSRCMAACRKAATSMARFPTRWSGA